MRLIAIYMLLGMAASAWSVTAGQISAQREDLRKNYNLAVTKEAFKSAVTSKTVLTSTATRTRTPNVQESFTPTRTPTK